MSKTSRKFFIASMFCFSIMFLSAAPATAQAARADQNQNQTEQQLIPKPPTPTEQAKQLTDYVSENIGSVPKEFRAYVLLSALHIEWRISDKKSIAELLDQIWSNIDYLDSPRNRVIMKNNVARYAGLLIDPEKAIDYLSRVPPPVADTIGFGGTKEHPVYDDYRYLALNKQIGPKLIQKVNWKRACSSFLLFAKKWSEDGGQYPVFAIFLKKKPRTSVMYRMNHLINF